jgi:hypothetical protein
LPTAFLKAGFVGPTRRDCAIGVGVKFMEIAPADRAAIMQYVILILADSRFDSCRGIDVCRPFLATLGLAAVTGASLPVDVLLGRRWTRASWHKLFVLTHKYSAIVVWKIPF